MIATSRRAAAGRTERPLLLAGLALVAAHLLDLSLSGPDTTVLGVAGVLGVPALWAAAQPRVTRATRFVLGLVFGLLALGFGVISHGLHVATSGPDWTDVTGVGFATGGALLIASGLAALASPPGPRPRVVHALGWLIGAAAFAPLAVQPVAVALQITHAPRFPIHESALGIAHEEVRIGGLSAWYVPSRNGAAVILSHGSGGSRARVAAHARMLARHGYGVLALDLPGNGESRGHSNGLGDNAQPALRAALDYLERRPDVHDGRIGGFGLSLGAEVLLEAAARDHRLRAVVADGATRPADAPNASASEKALLWISLQAVRGVSGTRRAPSLRPLMPRIAPRPVLLVASGGFPAEIPGNRLYQADGGPATQLWMLPDTGHTAGLRTHPISYERRTIGFLDGALR